MRLRLCFLLLVSAPGRAWDTLPHQSITRAALDSLPKRFQERFGAEAAPLIETYCLLPDRYVEMVQFGFVRNRPGPRSAAEIEIYCVRPDGLAMHGITAVREADLGSLVYLFERILSHLRENRSREAAKYAGVLSHYIADSLSPPHAVSPDRLQEIASQTASTCILSLHSAIERSIPQFTLSSRELRAPGAHLVDAAQAILDRCHAGAARNRQNLPSTVKAACAHDERALNVDRLRAGVDAAEILADALHSICGIAEGRDD